jgi:hypothetical protein
MSGSATGRVAVVTASARGLPISSQGERSRTMVAWQHHHDHADLHPAVEIDRILIGYTDAARGPSSVCSIDDPLLARGFKADRLSQHVYKGAEIDPRSPRAS